MSWAAFRFTHDAHDVSFFSFYLSLIFGEQQGYNMHTMRETERTYCYSNWL